MQIRAVGDDARREDLVMERRNEHLHAVALDDLDAVEQMLLGEPRPPGRPGGRAAAQLIDELVDAARADDTDHSTGKHLPPCQLHQTAGLIRTSDFSSCLR